jgi:RNA polymerase sigma-70 factor (ECF subfamily)
MDGSVGILSFPSVGEGTRARTRVDHKNSEEAALIRRVQARDEMAFREIVERYQSKVFSIIYGSCAIAMTPRTSPSRFSPRFISP